MRIAFICKRRYMGKDVIDDRYARLYEMPRQLALLGHDVVIATIGYQGQSDGEWKHDARPGSLRLRARGIRPPWLSLLAYPGRLLAEMKTFRPDVVIGASDIPNVALASRLARRLSVPLVVDLYDNFESFGQARFPGMVPALRRATRAAALVTTTSQALADFVRIEYAAPGKIIALPSTIDSAVFRPRDKTAARKELGLPIGARLIGTAGGLHRSKGIEELFAAWKLLQVDPRNHLVLAGPLDSSVDLPSGSRVHYLGQLPHEHVASLFSALDVATVSVLDTAFGRYCFPQKAYEILATGTPIVASDVGAMHDLLASYPMSLYRPGDPGSMANHITLLLDAPMQANIKIDDWAALIARLEPELAALIRT